MSQRTKLILILLVMFAALAAIVVVWRTMGRPTVAPAVISEPELGDFQQQPAGGQEGASVLPEPIILDEESKQELGLAQRASDFAMKFGSYSKSSNMENIRELIPQMTEEMRIWAQDYVAEQLKSMPAQFGITTKVLSKKVLDYEEGKTAVVLLSTQRQETSVGRKDIYYQEVEIEFSGAEGEWKVSRLEWQPL